MVILALINAYLVSAGLYIARAGGFVVSAPLLSRVGVPTQVRLILILCLGLAFTVAHGPGTISNDPINLILFMPIEFLLGTLLGFTARIIVSTVLLTGEIISYQMSFAFASFVDPGTDTSSAITTRLIYVIFLLTFLSVDAHHLMILAVNDSFRIFPIGTSGLRFINPEILLDLSNNMIYLGFRLALPIMAGILTVNIVLGIIARVLPQVNVFLIGFILTILTGLFFLNMLIPDMVRYFVVLSETVYRAMLQAIGG